MLLSMYLSYRLANRGKDIHILLMGFSVLLVSFCSALLPVGDDAMAFFFLPISVLSLPFYGFVDSFFIEGLEWVPFVKIRFFTLDLTAFLPMSRGRQVAFPLYLLVNTVGALLGYWVGRKHRIQFVFSNAEWLVLQLFAAIGSIVYAFIIGGTSWFGQYIGFNLFLFGFFMVDTLLLSLLLYNHST